MKIGNFGVKKFEFNRQKYRLSHPKGGFNQQNTGSLSIDDYEIYETKMGYSWTDKRLVISCMKYC